jgi:hypothetical protein
MTHETRRGYQIHRELFESVGQEPPTVGGITRRRECVVESDGIDILDTCVTVVQDALIDLNTIFSGPYYAKPGEF